MAKDFSFIVVSYVPLLVGTAGESMDITDPSVVGGLMDDIESLPSGWADGCLWAKGPSGAPYPVLVMPEARRIAEHLSMWSEGSPADWFDLHIKSRGEKYALSLMPRTRKSIERFEMAYHLRNGLPIPPKSHYNILFKPLHFCTGSSTTFRQIRHLLRSESLVGLVDPDELHPSNLSETDDSTIQILGTFRIGLNKTVDRYMDDLLDGATKPSKSVLDRYRLG